MAGNSGHIKPKTKYGCIAMLKKKIKSLGMSYKDFANMLEVSYRTLSNWERDGAPKVVSLLIEEMRKSRRKQPKNSV